MFKDVWNCICKKYIEALRFNEILSFSKKDVFAPSSAKFKFRVKYFFMIEDKILVMQFLSSAEIGENL